MVKSQGTIIESFSPVDGKLIASVTATDAESLQACNQQSTGSFSRMENVAIAKKR
jgi:hypothetical protein